MGETGIIYARASRDPKQTGTSVDAQVLECQRWAADNGVEVVGVYRDDNRSASRAAKRPRDGYAEVVRLIEARTADLLICWESSRASRDVAEFALLMNTCEDADVHLVLSGQRIDLKNPDQRVLAIVGAATSDSESRRIRARNVRTAQLSADAGRPHGRLPYGYQRVYDEQTGQLLQQVPLEPEAKVIRDATAALLAGDTLRAICRRLNADGVPTPRKARSSTPAADRVTQWEPSTLRQLLLKPANAGLRQHQGKVIGQATWEGLVSEADYYRLRSVLLDPARLTVRSPRGPAPRHLLTGIAVCGECGARLKATSTSPRMPRAYTCRGEGCMRVQVSADRADEVVTAVLRRYFLRGDVREVIARQHTATEEAGDAAAAAGDQLAVLRQRLDDAASAYAAGELSSEMLGAVERRLRAEILDVERQTDALVADPAVARLAVAPDPVAAWEGADLTEQRHLLKVLFRVTVKRARTTGRVFDPRRVAVELRRDDAPAENT